MRHTFHYRVVLVASILSASITTPLAAIPLPARPDNPPPVAQPRTPPAEPNKGNEPAGRPQTPNLPERAPRDGEDAAVVARLVKQLGATDAEEQDAAEINLYRLLPTAFPALEAAANDARLDARTKARLQQSVDRQRPWVVARLKKEKAENATFEWNQRTALEAYEKVGKKDPRWDEAARRGIRAFVTRGLDHAAAAGPLGDAIKAGCDDPLVLYLAARTAQLAGTTAGDDLDKLYHAACDAVEHSQYPAARKLIASLYYFHFKRDLVLARVRETGLRPPVDESVILGHEVDVASQEYPKAVEEGMPERFLIDEAHSLLAAYQASGLDSKPGFDFVYGPLEKTLHGSATALAFKAQYYVDYAWEARGEDWAKNVTSAGWKRMRERLAVAEEACRAAWEKDPTDAWAAKVMLSVELGQGKGRDVMETWFKRAVDLDPDYFDAYMKKVEYLQPKWYGSEAELIAFGRECYQTHNWYAKVPLLLVEAHIEAAEGGRDEDAYYARPAVWKDVQMVYLPYLRAKPDDAFSRSLYTRLACQGGHWAEARRQFEILGDRAMPEKFKGADKMRRYKQEAYARGQKDGGL